MEHTPKIETLSPAKQELLKMESEGLYVFHGSGADVEELEPQQARDTIRGLDGAPAVFASPFADVAIFHSIANHTNFNHGSVSSSAGVTLHEDGSLTPNFAITKSDFEQMKEEAIGFVYVFNKSDFQARDERGDEFVSLKNIRPIKRVFVTKIDLPKNITLT